VQPYNDIRTNDKRLEKENLEDVLFSKNVKDRFLKISYLIMQLHQGTNVRQKIGSKINLFSKSSKTKGKLR
jgi:hypothetical protein